MITPIERLTTIAGESPSVQPSSNSGEQGLFASIFQSAIDNVKQTEADVVQAEYLMATGQLDNPALLSIAETKASLAVDLLVQLRNRAMEAYSEVTRISM